MRFSYVAILVLVVNLGCNQAEVTPTESIEKDVRDFTLPAEVVAAAPHMQAHLYKLLPFNSSRFTLKKEFVFLDMEREVRGQSHPHISQLNMLHIAWWKGESLSWSGSLLLGEKRGWMGFSERRFRIKMKPVGDMYEFSLIDGEKKVEARISSLENSSQWVGFEDGRLYLNYMVLAKDKNRQGIPSSLSRMPGELKQAN